MFLDDNYLLGGETAKRIFSRISGLPVVDPHNHCDMAALAANRPFSDLWQLFGATDHYVWEVMRKAGVEERFITGDATAREKFGELCRVMPRIAGNPVFEWLHLDLRTLGIDGIMSAESTEGIWNRGIEALARDDNRPMGLLAKANVEELSSTDDPVDTLEHHATVNAAAGRTLVRPTWRPDKAMNPSPKYIKQLGERFGIKIRHLDDLFTALRLSHEYFAERGCRASDHALLDFRAVEGDKHRADKVFRRVLAEKPVSADDMALLRNSILAECAELDAETDWVCQLHMGAVRDVRTGIFETLGPDAGGDVCRIGLDLFSGLIPFLNRFDGRLKTVLYTLDPGYLPTLATVTRAFGNKVALGAAWWLCDTPVGMRRHMEYIGSVDLFSAFAGMVSDSRKLLSYGSRFAMFRRVLADVLGRMVDLGQMPEQLAVDIAVGMSYANVKKFWNL
ncbi:MAG: glucuronate isomerase [Victivallaceae bacterium]|nr:glucuronate isomerase [Victivallaceae bacterium]